MANRIVQINLWPIAIALILCSWIIAANWHPSETTAAQVACIEQRGNWSSSYLGSGKCSFQQVVGSKK